MSSRNVNSTDAESAIQILKVVPRTMRYLRTELRTLAKSELTVPQFRILLHLGERETLNNGQLAEIHGVSVAAMSRMVDGLVRRGLIERTASEKDRRQIVLKLSPSGRALHDRIMMAVQSSLEQRLSQLKSQPKQNLATGLSILEEIFQ